MQPRIAPVLIAVLATTAALTLADAALAQAPKSSTAVAPLTVQGAAPPKTIEKQAWSFVQSYTVGTAKVDRIARWEEPICVETVNFTADQAAMVKGRIEEVARGVGLPTARKGCASNIQIVLTSQPQAFIDKAAKADENVLGFHWPSELKKAKTVTRPIQAWYKTATRGAGNANDLYEAHLTDKFGNYVDPRDILPIPTSPDVVDIAGSGGPVGCAGSLIHNCTRSIFKNVLVVVDSRAAAGKALGPLADYLAMMALSQAKSAEGCTALPSVFDLMAKTPCPGREPTDGLSPADAAFLTALYTTTNREVAAVSEQGEISDRMAQMLVNNGKAIRKTAEK